jgi:DNA polymerase elongation subunit (family B)
MFRKKLNKLPTGDLEMQVVDWCNYDVNFTEDEDSYDSDDEPRYRKVDRKYVIRAYGLNAEGQSMCVHINDFTPYFFIRIPQKWTQKEVNRMVDEVGKKVKYYAKQALLNSQIVMKKEFYGFTNNKEFKYVRLVFKNIWAFRQYIEVFKKAIRVNNKVYKFPLYESNILPMLRFMHCRDVIPAAWIKIPKGKYDYEDITRCQIEVSVNWKDVEPLDKNDIGPVIIASFDLECTSGDGSFPVAKKASDKIIQIGTTVHKNGDDECFLHHILTLKKPEEIKKEEVDAENLIVEYFDDEKKMIIAWGKFIEKLDPDIITGYNIWGFDMAYLYDRAKLGNGGETFDYSEVFLERLSRNKEEYAIAKYREQGLSSSALGDNTLKFFEMEGLVSIDMLKVIQRDHKLESYKLDFVAKNFLVPERVDMFESKYFELMENNMGQTELSENKEYIEKLEEFVEEIEEYGNLSRDFKDSYQENKDKLIKIGNMKELDKCIDKCRDLYKIDLPPRKIFENFVDGSPEKIKEIAVYCLKDCELVNKLIMKLNILPNNIGMANVCCVPFNYLFTRGQGIKTFSLVAKECRKEGYLVKVLKPDPNDKSSYEGAIVFTPKPGIYFEPIAVNDYASLYPSSMIAENLSHDSLVWIKVFDNEGNLLKVINGALETIEEYEDGKLVKKTGELRYTDLDDYNYNEIKYDNLEKYDDSKHSKVDKKYIIEAKPDNKVLTGYTICCYAENKDGSKSLVPRILQKLLQARKDTRKRIIYKTVKLTDGKEYSGLLNSDKTEIICEKEGKIELNPNDIVNCEDTFDDFMKTVWDCLQLSFKVSCNSVYGATGAKTSSVFNKFIAASTTAVGRSMVLLAKDTTLKHFPGTKCVYGDSVSGDTPLLLKAKDGKIEFKTIETLSEEWVPYEEFKPFDTNRKEKQQSKSEYQVWTENGWANIKRVIRHKTNKKMYRVNTHTGCIDVSEDHSLLNVNKEKIKPTDCKVGTKLLHSYPEFEESNTIKFVDIYNRLSVIENLTIEEKEAFIFGFFYGDGSCGYYHCKSGNKYSWALNNKDKELLNKCLSYLKDIETMTDFTILETMKSSNVNKLVPKGSIKYMVNKYREIFYDKDKYKTVPKSILNANRNIRLQFLIGYYASDGSKCINEKTKCIRFDNKGKIGSAQLYYLMKSLGYKCSINTREDKPNIYRITATTTKQRKDPTEIKKMSLIDFDCENNYIYDLETETGTFHGGVGELTVKNTDSVFLSFKDYIAEKHRSEGELSEYRKMELTEKYCTEAANLVTSISKQPQNLEFEKILYPFIIFSKKRYVSNKYEGSITKFKQNSMGIVLKRRDNAPIVKDIYGGIIDTILNERNIDKAKEFFKERVANLLEGNADIKRLIITKSLRGNYANPTQIAHKVLADRIGERDPGNKPMPSDRIPYCYIDPKILKCHKCGKDKLNEKDCKCRVCMKLYCNLHLKSHRELCKKMCRFCRKETPVSEIKMCKTCGGYYCKDDMVKHTMRTDKYKEVHYDKCKKLLPQKLIQGDILEHPDYIMENDLKIDYKYYLDHQIEKPCMQIFSLTMKNPYSLIATAVRKYNNKRNGNQEITQWFQIMNKTQAPMDDEDDDDEENIRTYNVDDIFGPIQDTNDYTDGFDMIPDFQ